MKGIHRGKLASRRGQAALAVHVAHAPMVIRFTQAHVAGAPMLSHTRAPAAPPCRSCRPCCRCLTKMHLSLSAHCKFELVSGSCLRTVQGYCTGQHKDFCACGKPDSNNYLTERLCALHDHGSGCCCDACGKFAEIGSRRGGDVLKLWSSFPQRERK